MDPFTMTAAVIALAEGVRNSADVPVAVISAKREETARIAEALGAPAVRAGQIAEEVERALTEFADALVTAGHAAEKVNAVANKHSEELRKHVQAN